jgi:hypothetical protein
VQIKGLNIRSTWLASIVLFAAVGVARAATISPPTISWVNENMYAVSYKACSTCVAHGLEEFNLQSQRWDYIGSGTIHFGGRSPGTYRYRVVYGYAYGPSEYQLSVSAETSVVVGGDYGVPPTDPVPDGIRLADGFRPLSGDIDGDGLRDLLLLRPDSGDSAPSGAIGDVLLRQAPDGSLQAAVPSDFQLAIAASWTPATIELRQRDVNVDGYQDLVIRGVAEASGLSNVSNQIVFAAGAAGATLAPTVRPVDQNLARFSRDIDRHLIDPEYYPANGPMTLGVVHYYAFNCGWPDYDLYLDSYYSWYCYLQGYKFYFAYQDFSGYDQDAIAIAESDYSMIHGFLSTEDGMRRIANRLENVLDVDIGQVDDFELPGGDETVTDDAVRRGIELFAVLAGISEAVAQADTGSVDSPVVERVQLRGRRVLGQGPFHTSLAFRSSTVSSYDSDPQLLVDGLLISEVDWPRDHPSLTLRLGYVDGPLEPALYWDNVLNADSRYGDDLRYDVFPSIGEGGYNSNSYIGGLIQATFGVPTIEMTSFVGGEKPVPASAFN